MESGGLTLECARAQLVGSLGAEPETILILSKSAKPPRGDQSERSTFQAGAWENAALGRQCWQDKQDVAGRKAPQSGAQCLSCTGHAEDSSGAEAGGFTHPFSFGFSEVHPLI